MLLTMLSLDSILCQCLCEICHSISHQQFQQNDTVTIFESHRQLQTQSGSPIRLFVTGQYLQGLNARNNVIRNHAGLGSLLQILRQQPGVRPGLFQVLNYGQLQGDMGKILEGWGGEASPIA